MKRIAEITRLLLVVSVLQAAEVCSGQSTFFFRNFGIHQTGILDAPVFDADGNRLFGLDYVAILYGGPTQDSLTPALSLLNGQPMTPVPVTVTSPLGERGYFRAASEVYILGVGGTEFAWLQVKVWDLRLGSSYDQVVSLGMGGYGESNLFYAQSGNEAASIPPGFLIGLESFSLVPEPSAALLLLLCLPWLFVRKRRNK